VTSALALALACGLLAAGAPSADERPADPVDLNLATLEELQRLPGIGPRKAEAIVALRKKRPFTRVTQLLEVKGVGRKTLERLKPWVHVPVTPVRAAASSAPSAAPRSTAAP
jgi:competence ComEA-like helix-hairpin-helix protein